MNKYRDPTDSKTPTLPELSGISEMHYVLAVIVCTTLVAFSVNMSATPSFSILSSVSLLNICLLIGAYLLMIRSSATIPNIGVTFLISFWSILIFNLSSHLAFIGLPFCLVIPSLVLWLTKSYMHCIISLFVQLINISLLFRVNLEESIKYLPMDKLTERLVQCLTLGSFLVVLVFGYVFRAKIDPKENPQDVSVTYQDTNTSFESTVSDKKLVTNYISEVKSVFETLNGSLSLLSSHMEQGLGSKLIKIANISAEKLQRIICNMTEMNHEDVEIRKPSSTLVNVKSFFKNFWESSLLQMHQKGLDGVLKVEHVLPEAIEIDNFKVDQALSNIMDYFIHSSSCNGPIEMTVEAVRSMSDQAFFGFMTLPEEMVLKCENAFFSTEGEYTRKTGRMNRKNKMLQITIKSLVSKEYSEHFEDVLVEVENEELPFRKNNEMIKLGLQLSKKICKKLGGKLKTYSRNKTGTAFVMYVPYGTV